MSVKKILLLILVLGFLVRASPILIDSLSGPDPYFHARMSEIVVAEQAVPFYDELSMQGRYYSYAPLLHTTFAVFSLISGTEILLLVKLLPTLYAVAGILLVFVFARRIFKNETIALFAALAISIMPLHLMRTASYTRPDSFALLLIPAIIYFIYIKRFRIASLVTIAQVLLHPLSTLYLFLFLIIWGVVWKVKKYNFELKKVILITALGTAVFGAWLLHLPYSPLDYISGVSFESVEMAAISLQSFFFLFAFSWIFILVALLKTQNQKFLYAWFLISLLYAVVSYRFSIFLAIPAALFAGGGLYFVLQKVKPYWHVFTLLILVLALFAVVPEVSSTSKYVQDSERSAMLWLKESTPVDSVIFAEWDQGHPLTYLAQRQVVIDGYFEFAPDLQERNNSMKRIVSTSNCAKIKTEAGRFGTDYFYAHKQALNSMALKNGILEADCDFMDALYASDGARIIGFS